MPYSVISNFTFEPQLASEYASAAFVENMILLARTLGVVRETDVADPQYHSSLNHGGQAVELPYFADIASLIARRDLDSVAAPTDLDITGSKDLAVILRRRAGPVKFTEDLFIRGLNTKNIEHEIGKQMGNRAALQARVDLFTVVIAALDSLDTPSANCHISDIWVASAGTKANLTIQRLLTGRMLLKDAYNQLSTVVMHSEAFADLVADGIANYKVENVGGMMIVSEIAQLFGLRIVVCDDATLISDADAYRKYRTLLFGRNALSLIYARKMHISAERRLDFEAPYWRVLGNVDYAPHLHGMKWASATMNPDATDLGTAANWDEAYNDHREVLAAEIIHNASAN